MVFNAVVEKKEKISLPYGHQQDLSLSLLEGEAAEPQCSWTQQLCISGGLGLADLTLDCPAQWQADKQDDTGDLQTWQPVYTTSSNDTLNFHVSKEI